MGIYTSNFDFNKYRAFYAVAECKSFSRATELLHVSQPAISRSVKELEEQLDTQLFIRGSKSVKLTENGEKLMGYVQNAFNNILMAERSITESDKELTGEIRIGIYGHISLFMLPKLIKDFVLEHPKVKFDVITTGTEVAREKLKNKEFDFVILQYPIFINDSNYKEEILCEMENCFFTSKKYYDLYMQNNSKRLVEYPLILPTRGYDDINSLEEMFKRKNMIGTTNLRIYAIDLIKELVKKDMGIGWGLRKCVEKELKDKTFYEIPIDFMNPTTKFSIAYNEKSLDRTTLKFLEYLREYFKKEFR